MADTTTKLINTRIKNKVASLSDWQGSNGKLLNGEIAIVRVPTGDEYTNPITGKKEPVVELLMKVGDGEHTFNEVDANGNPYLPWLSAKASDVYNWAKTPDIKDVAVKVKKGTDSDYTENTTLEAWLKTVYDKGIDNAAAIADIDKIVDKLDDADTVDGSVRQLIKAAIESLDAKDEINPDNGTFVKAVTQVDGKIQVTKGRISASELPSDISAAQILVNKGAENQKTLVEKLGDIDAALSSLDRIVEGGVHFLGKAAEMPEDASVTIQVSETETKTETAIEGDIIIFGDKEFIYVAAAWEELGDLSRVGDLEDWRAGLNYSAVVDGIATDNKFVVSVTQADGKVAATYARPTAGDIIYDNRDLDTVLAAELPKLADITADEKTVGGKISTELAKLILTEEPTSGGEAAETENFVTQVRQANGQVSYERKALPVATTTNKGIVKLSSDTNSEVENVAATPKAVKVAYDKADDAQTRVAAIEPVFVRFNADDRKLYVGTNGQEEIIFDCGGAPLV